jgi:hypothetical protein
MGGAFKTALHPTLVKRGCQDSGVLARFQGGVWRRQMRTRTSRQPGSAGRTARNFSRGEGAPLGISAPLGILSPLDISLRHTSVCYSGSPRYFLSAPLDIFRHPSVFSTARSMAQLDVLAPVGISAPLGVSAPLNLQRTFLQRTFEFPHHRAPRSPNPARQLACHAQWLLPAATPRDWLPLLLGQPPPQGSDCSLP